MANRDLSTFRRVTDQVADTSGQDLQTALVSIGANIVETSQEARLTQRLSEAQLQLNTLDNEFRISNQSDPFSADASKDYKESRREIFDTLADGISPFYRKQWEEKVANLSRASDISNQAWGFSQSRQNTVNDLQGTLQADMALAAETGRSFGLSESTDIESVIRGFAPARQKLTEFATKRLGPETADQLLENYDEDYLKSFISGVAEQNPTKALQLLNNDLIKDSISDSKTYSQFKNAIENRALRLDEIQKNNQTLKILNDNNNILSKSSLTEPIPYVELQVAFDKNNLPKATRDFFLKANGYQTSKSTLSNSEKEGLKLQVFSTISDIAKDKEGLTTQKVAGLQETIYKAVDAKAVTRAEGAQLINTVLSPLIEKKSESLSAFSDGEWNPFVDNVGFTQVEDFFEDEVVLPEPTDKKQKAFVDQINNTRQLSLFENYYNSLQKEADARQIGLLDIQDLPSDERADIYTKSFQRAKELFARDSFPGVRALSETPNDIVTQTGEVINIKNQRTKLEADAKINDIKIQLESDASGNKARIHYKEGKRVKAEVLAADGTVIEEIFFDDNGRPL